jgi:hypothetical protein
MLSNANEWMETEMFGRKHEDFLQRYMGLLNGVPSHDTIYKIFATVSPEFLQKLRVLWNQMLNSAEGEKVRKIFAEV